MQRAVSLMLLGLCLVATTNAQSSIRFYFSETDALDAVPPEYYAQTNPVIEPGQEVYLWAMVTWGDTWIGVDLQFNGADGVASGQMYNPMWGGLTTRWFGGSDLDPADDERVLMLAITTAVGLGDVADPMMVFGELWDLHYLVGEVTFDGAGEVYLEIGPAAIERLGGSGFDLVHFGFGDAPLLVSQVGATSDLPDVTVGPNGGACCFEDGTCLIAADEFECYDVHLGLWYMGDGTSCSPNPCLQACCFDDGSCQQMSALDCWINSGIAQGFGTDCSPNPCPQPGACCFADGSCTMSTLIDPGDCGPDGTYQGDGTVCDPNPCPVLWCLGDMDCSGGSSDFLDISYFVAALNGEANWVTYYESRHGGASPPCFWLMGDFSTPRNGVDFLDIVPFANSIGQPCIEFEP